jgi:hypothetical protein
MEALSSSELLVCSVTSFCHTLIAVGGTTRDHISFMNLASGFITGSHNDISVALDVRCILRQMVFFFGY